MKSSNPMFRDSIYKNTYDLLEKPMTLSGTVNKLLLLTVLMFVAAAAVFYQFSMQRYDYVSILTTAGVIVGFICAIIMAFKHNLTPYIAPIYAFSQGALLSGISCFFEASYPGIVIQAVSITFITVLAMGLLFKAKVIEATEKFRAVLLTATFAIAIFYLISFVISFFGVNVPYFSSTSPIAIVVNVIFAIVAALNLIIDFDNIDRGVKTPLPAYFEWYCAVGLLATIVWLYIEILRLLARTRNK